MSAFIERYRDRFGVELICRTLGTSASAYYQRRTGERSARQIEDERRIAKIRTIFAENYESYGVRRMHAAMVRDGEQIGRDQVARLMRKAGLRGAKRRGKPWRTTIGDPRLRSVRISSTGTSPPPRRTCCGSAISRICGPGRARSTSAS